MANKEEIFELALTEVTVSMVSLVFAGIGVDRARFSRPLAFVLV